MSKSAHQRLLDEAMTSLQQGRRTAEFDALLLSFFPEKDREFLREIVGLPPSATANTVKLANAAALFEQMRDQFNDDEAAVKYVADVANIHSDTLRRAGKDKANHQVNQLNKQRKFTTKI